jgi:hypothetical protein
MAEIGVATEDLFIGATPEQARSTLKRFSSSDNEAVNYIFNVASWSSPGPILSPRALVCHQLGPKV